MWSCLVFLAAARRVRCRARDCRCAVPRDEKKPRRLPGCRRGRPVRSKCRRRGCRSECRRQRGGRERRRQCGGRGQRRGSECGRWRRRKRGRCRQQVQVQAQARARAVAEPEPAPVRARAVRPAAEPRAEPGPARAAPAALRRAVAAALPRAGGGGAAGGSAAAACRAPALAVQQPARALLNSADQERQAARRATAAPRPHRPARAQTVQRRLPGKRPSTASVKGAWVGHAPNRTMCCKAIYFNPKRYRSRADCLTAAYSARVPLEMCR